MGRHEPTEARTVHTLGHYPFPHPFKVGCVQNSSLNGSYDCVGRAIAHSAVAVNPTPRRCVIKVLSVTGAARIRVATSRTPLSARHPRIEEDPTTTTTYWNHSKGGIAIE